MAVTIKYSTKKKLAIIKIYFKKSIQGYRNIYYNL